MVTTGEERKIYENTWKKKKNCHAFLCTFPLHDLVLNYKRQCFERGEVKLNLVEVKTDKTAVRR